MKVLKCFSLASAAVLTLTSARPSEDSTSNGLDSIADSNFLPDIDPEKLNDAHDADVNVLSQTGSVIDPLAPFDPIKTDPVITCDGNFKLKMSITGEERFWIRGDYLAGKCDRHNTGVSIDKNGDYTVDIYINLETCLDNMSGSSAGKMSYFNKAIPVLFSIAREHQGESKQAYRVDVSCEFTDDYIIEQRFDELESKTIAVVDNTLANIDGNLQFQFYRYTDSSYLTYTEAMKDMNVHEQMYLKIQHDNGLNTEHMLTIPTACYMLKADGSNWKLWSLPHDDVCSLPLTFNQKWGTWSFDFNPSDVATIPTGITNENYKIECSIKVCPNYDNNVCANFIKECNFEDFASMG